MDENNRRYYMYAMGQRVEVTEKLYRECKSIDNAEEYGNRCYLQNCISFDESREQKRDGIHGMPEVLSPEDIVIAQENKKELAGRIALMKEKLKELPEEEYNIIQKVYFNNIPDGKAADQLGIPRTTFQYKRYNALKELRRLMEK